MPPASTTSTTAAAVVETVIRSEHGHLQVRNSFSLTIAAASTLHHHLLTSSPCIFVCECLVARCVVFVFISRTTKPTPIMQKYPSRNLNPWPSACNNNISTCNSVLNTQLQAHYGSSSSIPATLKYILLAICFLFTFSSACSFTYNLTFKSFFKISLHSISIL